MHIEWAPARTWFIGSVVVALAGTFFAGVAFAAPAPGGPMVDPAIDDPAGEWCYLAKSTTVIGLPWQEDVTQITFDGAIFTRRAELCFFYGNPLQPVLARQKTFLDGWIPVVQYQWRCGPIAYSAEIFAAGLDDKDAFGTDGCGVVNFARVQMRNTGDAKARGVFLAAMRHSGGDSRSGGSAYRPTDYEMTDQAALRGGELVYAFSPGGRREAVPGQAYEGKFPASKHHVTARTEVCAVRYEKDLGPGESASMVFKMPRVPIPASKADLAARVLAADYPAHRDRIVSAWKDRFARGMTMSFPEKRVQGAWAASLVHLMLATRQRDGQRFLTDGLPYPDLFLLSLVQHEMALDYCGHGEFFRQSLPRALAQQTADGLFADVAVTQGLPLPVSQGHMLHALSLHGLLTGDREFARSIYPRVVRQVDWVRRARAGDEYGLIPPVYPYDAEMIDGHYTSTNLWTLLGLRSAIRLARLLGEDADAKAWLALHEEYQASVLQALDATAGKDGYVPPGLYKYLIGRQARRGFADYQTHCDWENMLLASPTEVLSPQDPRVEATLRKVRRQYAEAIMTYRHGQHLHQYITTNMLEQYLVRGEQETALRDFYHVLLHCGSTHEGFENLVRPWTNRMVEGDCPPPHAWAASKLVLACRNLLVMERGGRAGLDEGQRDLHLFSILSPAWVVPGKSVSFRNATTEMGKVSASIAFQDDGADVEIQSGFHRPPRAIVVHVPWFVELTGFTTDAKQSSREGDTIVLGSDATRARLTWRTRPDAHRGTFEALLRAYRSEDSFQGVDAQGKPIIQQGGEGFVLDSEKRTAPTPLSFQLVREAFEHEYARRYKLFVEAGGKPTVIAAPPLCPALDPAEVGLAVGCPVRASASLAPYPPANAVDGDAADLQSSWQNDSYPAWLEIDLQKEQPIRRIHVFPYWGMGRYYQYVVEVSQDGKVWRQVADMSKNTKPATPAGDDFRFPSQPARYVRVTMLYHSLNKGVHLVEVRVYGRGI